MKTPRKRTTSTDTTADTSTASKRPTRKSADMGDASGSGDGQTMQRRSSAPRADDMPKSDEEIRERAYEIFLERGGTPGRELDDWLQAEQEQRKQNGTTRSGQRPQSSPPAP